MFTLFTKSLAILIATIAFIACNFEKNSDSTSKIQWGLPGVASAPEVYTVAVTPLTGTETGENYGYVEFIRTPYGVIANTNLVYIDPGTYFVSISDRKSCVTGKGDYPPAQIESEIGVIKTGVDEVTRISKILSEFERREGDLIGKCIEVTLVASETPLDTEATAKPGMVAVGSIGAKEPTDLVF